MKEFNNYEIPFPIANAYKKRVAYFSMEFGIDQALKIYSGGLGYLAGSHMRSAYELKQNLVGIGILWKCGYYDQVRKPNNEMDVLFQEKQYNFLKDTGIVFEISVHNHPVKVKAWYLDPETFGTAPLFLLSTDLPENDYLSKSICHRLYSNNVETKIAQSILLGKGGAKLLEQLNFEPDIYHLNEAHALPAAFHLYEKSGNLAAVKSKLVFTTHTPVEAGNEKHNVHLLQKMSFFGNIPMQEVLDISGATDGVFSHSLVALRMAKMANGVSKMHGEVSRLMWKDFEDICPITHITNAQNYKYWHDETLEDALEGRSNNLLIARKKELKKQLFDIVADQTGKIFDPEVLTIVWARRYAGYKRADLITRDLARFERIVNNTEQPVQIIWAGKPYPMDYEAVNMFNALIHLSKNYPNLAVLTGYELSLSKALKQGSDVWLNNPRVPREASGTSGMTAAMNGSVNLSTADGWIPEFARNGKNSFVVPLVDQTLSFEEQDAIDGHNLLEAIENEIVPMYYNSPKKWWSIVRAGAKDLLPFFDSDRMADEYYSKLYAVEVNEGKQMA